MVLSMVKNLNFFEEKYQVNYLNVSVARTYADLKNLVSRIRFLIDLSYQIFPIRPFCT